MGRNLESFLNFPPPIVRKELGGTHNRSGRMREGKKVLLSEIKFPIIQLTAWPQ